MLWTTVGTLTSLYLLRAEDAVRKVQATQAVLMAIALATLTCVVLFLLPPSIRKVNKGRDSTLDLFLAIPVTRVQEITAAKIDLLAQMGLAAEATGIAVFHTLCTCFSRVCVQKSRTLQQFWL